MLSHAITLRSSLEPSIHTVYPRFFCQIKGMYALSIGDVLALILLLRDILAALQPGDAEADFQSTVSFVQGLLVTLTKIERDVKRAATSVQSAF